MSNADLRDADLRDAALIIGLVNGVSSWAGATDKQLAKAKSLEGATLPDGTMHE